MRTRTLSAVVAGSATAALLLTGVGAAAAAPATSDKPSKASAPATAQGAATPAKAAWDGNIYLYYSTAANSAWRAYSGGTADFAADTFNNGVDGYGQRVKNNVNRAWNNDQRWAANIWYNENFQGAVDTFYPGEARQLKVGVRNDNASLSWTYIG
ncbi:hypothetical protein [Streptomyces griseorubiginosus]|uniref:hypothetical protein n=1 Tax=Streptomyces griseorubiginosus TaxID=67304 RepID=UPI002E809AF8|nr:hypothetical protein [Streptomyces griseorubiginosus]WUB48871.1 hypothetical protein OHN19_38240 [Streptomyces griseorubiginosus]WUB57398.1 hypothetical protein OG942_38250 [Streptomyces griseorubiginosus]